MMKNTLISGVAGIVLVGALGAAGPVFASVNAVGQDTLPTAIHADASLPPGSTGHTAAARADGGGTVVLASGRGGDRRRPCGRRVC